MRADDMRKCFGEHGRVVEALWPPEAETEAGGGLGEGNVDIVEDLDVVAEEADRLQDDAFVALLAEGGEGVLDGRADPGAAGDSLALEGEVPSRRTSDIQLRKLTFCRREDELGGALGFDRVRVWRGLRLRSGAGSDNGGFAGHDGSARDGVGGEEDGECGAGLLAGLRVGF